MESAAGSTRAQWEHKARRMNKARRALGEPRRAPWGAKWRGGQNQEKEEGGGAPAPPSGAVPGSHTSKRTSVFEPGLVAAATEYDICT